MIKYQLPILGVIVSLDSDSPNESALIEYEGISPENVAIARSYLSREYGAFGHLIKDACTPLDLDAAMRKPAMQRYLPEIVEGEELVQRCRPNIPPGAVT